MEYRREIDGLRALAVIPVILFHSGYTLFSGGFVGVDIFFVISGYLITSLILSEKESNRFAIASFYERRARRILPALFLVMFCSIPAAWLLLFPENLIDFSDSLISIPLLSSNILFWKTSGYFEGAAEMKPLLHTWSLAVEEQYYLLFPISILLFWRTGRRWMIFIFTITGLLSLFFAQWASGSSPVANFYLLPSRVWELLLGAIIAAMHLPFTSSDGGRKTLNNAGGIAGLILIVYSVIFFDESTPTPGYSTLLPTVGAALILIFATKETATNRILSSGPMVKIGLLSYSAYLWHQPLFSFAKHAGIAVAGGLSSAILIAATLVLSVCSWRFIEIPFRNRQIISRRQLWSFALIGSALFVGLGTAGKYSRGFESRISEDQRNFLAYFENSQPEWSYFKKIDLDRLYRGECNFLDIAKYRAGEQTQTPVQSIPRHCSERDINASSVAFLWGDSHAQQLNYGLRENLPKDWQILQVTSAGCPPSIHATANKKNYCEYSNWFALQAISKSLPEVVVLGQNNGHDKASMMEISSHLLQQGVKKVVFVGPTPHWVNELPNIIAQRFLPNTPSRTSTGIASSIERIDSKLKKSMSFDKSVKYVSAIDYFCDSNGCKTYYGDDVRSGITSYDRGHLTPIASFNFAKDVLARVVLE